MTEPSYLPDLEFHRIVMFSPASCLLTLSAKSFYYANEKLAGTESKQFIFRVAGKNRYGIIHTEKTLLTIVYLEDAGGGMFDLKHSL